MNNNNIRPNFAIIRLQPYDDLFALFRLLLDNGYPEVSFVQSIREDAFLPAIDLPTPQLNGHINGVDLPAPTTTIEVRQRGSRMNQQSSLSPMTNVDPTDDPSTGIVYANCRLCQNKIMASRLSNLTNHVRRHASLKQFQCCYCEYTHNEMAKVRLHMVHNHKDSDSQPIDNLSGEMQTQWDSLMDQCFPDYNKESFASKELATNSTSSPVHRQQQLFTCIDCGEQIDRDQLADHLRCAHASDCIPYACAECGYESRDQWKVRLHISVSHADRAADIGVHARESGVIDFDSFIAKFFPDFAPQTIKNDDEVAMLASIRSRDGQPGSIINEPPPAPPSTDGGGVRCQLCRKMMIASKPVSSLLNHAKRHYHVKQFQCPRCSYGSSEAAHVRSHIRLKHGGAGDDEKPIDNKNQAMQAAWMQVMLRCFPHVQRELTKFRFKNFASSSNEKPSRRSSRPTAAHRPKDALVKASQLQCRLCNESVPVADLASHADTHNDAAPLKPYGCSMCAHRTNEYQQLRIHMLKHKRTSLPPAIVGSQRNLSAPSTTTTNQRSSHYVKLCFGID